jgi:hypothetical protein
MKLFDIGIKSNFSRGASLACKQQGFRFAFAFEQHFFWAKIFLETWVEGTLFNSDPASMLLTTA